MVAPAIPVAAATIISSIALVITVITAFPKTINEYRVLVSRAKRIFSRKVTIAIDEFDGQVKTETYEAVEIYLGKILSSKNRNIKVSQTGKNPIKFTLEHNEKVKDVYYGHKFKWTWQEFKCFDHPKDINSVFRSAMKSFKLKFRKKDYDFVTEDYLPYIIEEAKFLKR